VRSCRNLGGNDVGGGLPGLVTTLVLVENKSWVEDPVVAAVAVEQEATVVPAEKWL
jgi:hypothetical protein